MRATVDLPPVVHHRVIELARSRNQSVSSMLAELTIRGLAALGDPIEIFIDPISGFPVVTLGRPITSADLTHAFDEEWTRLPTRCSHRQVTDAYLSELPGSVDLVP